VRLCGQYRHATGRSIRGKRAPWITYGYSKDHRPDLKQLLLTLTATSDGGVPTHFRCDDGNTTDVSTHLETWQALHELHGSPDFLYVADCKLCTGQNMEPIDKAGGRFVTVLPRSRREDQQFREWIQENAPPWEKVWDRPNPRKKRGARDVWYVYKSIVPSRENWPVIWVYSTLLRLSQELRRQDRIMRATQELERLRAKLEGPRPRRRSKLQIENQLQRIVSRLHVRDYVRYWVVEEEIERFRQSRPGRPGRDTLYRRNVRTRLTISFDVNEAAIAYDQKSDGMYPLLTNDRSLTPRQVLEAHKRQPGVETRFQQWKSVHELAPVFLKNEGRIVALFVLYFVALLVEALIEREIRASMKKAGIKSLALYPESRECKMPTAQSIFRLFSLVDRETIFEDGRELLVFEPELTDLQKQILNLLGVPLSAYRPS
jgi:transposase